MPAGGTVVLGKILSSFHFYTKHMRNRADACKLFDACCNCGLLVFVADPWLCTESISWLEPWPQTI